MSCLALKISEKRFLSGFPLKKWCWQDLLDFMRGDTGDGTENQRLVLDITINHQLMKDYPLKASYQLMFLKILMKKMEESEIEICGEMYEAFCHLLQKDGRKSTEERERHFRHFPLFNKYISLSESTNLVSEGTTGLHAWQASMALADWCLKHQDVLKGKMVLELGSGVGLTGLACVLGTHLVNKNTQEYDASDFPQHNEEFAQNCENLPSSSLSPCAIHSLTFSDCHPSVLKLLTRNVQQNLLQDILPSGEPETFEEDADGCTFLETCYQGTKVRVISLLWQDLAAGLEEAITAVGDVDIVIAADVVYDESLFEPLVGSLKMLLKIIKSDGTSPAAVLACTKRNQETLDEFLHLLTTSGLQAQEEKQSQPLHFEYDPDPPVSIYIISLQKNE